jgi:hypothetical protein
LDCENSLVPQNLPGIDESLHCPNETALQAFTDAIQRGDISWHAFPFNAGNFISSTNSNYAESETMDPSLFLYGVSMAHQLVSKYPRIYPNFKDQQFGKPPKTVMSQRDVPGLTRSVIPLLNQAGVQAITVGVNGNFFPTNSY